MTNPGYQPVLIPVDIHNLRMLRNRVPRGLRVGGLILCNDQRFRWGYRLARVFLIPAARASQTIRDGDPQAQCGLLSGWEMGDSDIENKVRHCWYLDCAVKDSDVQKEHTESSRLFFCHVSFEQIEQASVGLNVGMMKSTWFEPKTP